MTTILDCLRQRISAWGHLGHPALMERFVERNGSLFQAAPFAGERRMPKQCFQNATQFVYEHGGVYVEGYGWRESLPLLVHHAWVALGDTAIDPTWKNPEECQYFGVVIGTNELAGVMAETGYYGVLDPGLLNLDFMFRRDPGLREFLPERRTA